MAPLPHQFGITTLNQMEEEEEEERDGGRECRRLSRSSPLDAVVGAKPEQRHRTCPGAQTQRRGGEGGRGPIKQTNRRMAKGLGSRRQADKQEGESDVQQTNSGRIEAAERKKGDRKMFNLFVKM